MPFLQFKGKAVVETYHHTVPHHTLELDRKLSVIGKGEGPQFGRAPDGRAGQPAEQSTSGLPGDLERSFVDSSCLSSATSHCEILVWLRAAHLDEPRIITVRDAARLAGVPDTSRVYGSFVNQMEQETKRRSHAARPRCLVRTARNIWHGGH